MIEVRSDVDHAKPVPVLDDLNRHFWTQLAEGRLFVQECPACGHRQHYPRLACTVCNQTPGWLECSGLGTVYTFTVVRQFGGVPFRDELPYVVAMVELDEGPRLMSNVTDCAVEDVHIGLRVQAYAVPTTTDDEAIGIPYFRPY